MERKKRFSIELFFRGLLCLSFLHGSFQITFASEVRSYAEQFTTPELEPKSMMRSDDPTFSDEMPAGTNEVLEEEGRHEVNKDSFFLKKISLKGNTVYKEQELQFLYQSELNNLTTIHDLKKIAKKISNFYRKNGYILCRAVVPTQDVLDGDVTFIIHEEGITRVLFEGDTHSLDSLKDAVEEALKKSKPFRLQDLQTQLNLMRASAPVFIYPEMRPVRKNALEAEVIFVVKDLPPEVSHPLEGIGPTFILKDIHLEGNESIPLKTLKLLFQKDLNKPITEEGLKDIVKRISTFYRTQGYVLSRASLPSQEIEDGIARIVIKEGRLHTVALEGDTKGLNPHKVQEIEEAIDTTKPFHLKDLTRYVMLAQNLGHFHVYPSLKPVKNEVQADLVFYLQAMKPEEIREELAKEVTFPSEFRLNKITIAGNTAIATEDLQDLVKDKIGQVMDLSGVHQIVQTLTRYYRQEGYILSQAILPPQDVRDGEIQIKILEGYISEIVFEGDTQDLEKFLAYTADSIKKSRPLHLKDLESKLLILKDLPHLNVTSVMKPSPHVQYSSTLVVKLKKRYWEGTISGNNYGTQNVGPVQGSAMLTVTSPLHATHKINISGSKSYDPHELKLLQTGYTVPVGFEGAKVTLDTMMSRSNPSTAAFSSNLQVYGTEDRIGLSGSAPLVRGRYHNLFSNITFTARNVESKSSIGLTNTKDRIRKLSLGFVLDFSDVLKGLNILKFGFIKGVPVLGATKNNSTTKSRLSGRPDFSLTDFFASRDQHLFGSFSFYALIHGQVAFNPLLSAEQFRGGGMPYNKAYPNSAITGDSGVEWKTELRFIRPVEQYLQNYMLYAYFSEIRIWNKVPQAGEKKSGRARGIGVGARATFQSGPTLEFEYGRPITSLVNNQHYKSKVLLGFTYSLNSV